MRIASQSGFTLMEMMVALAISAVLLPSVLKVLPFLTLQVSRETQRMQLDDELWQLAFTVGKHIQRAGYCNGECVGAPIYLQSGCLVVQWDSESTGKWPVLPAAQPAQFGFRINGESLQTSRGAQNCQQGNWERITDPEWMVLTLFTIVPSPHDPAVFEVSLAGYLRRYPQVSLSVLHSVAGYNLP
ncbi:prepilin peptidase-dependent protein [Mangrovibacter yixingensis]|uniref:prepilin peptidase-dependent protein n=1 Tax=Mangrovibacter yixingensis TaxID=1529639 RepID=UPI0021F5221D|nr:prepilin peptidase-dependent protein [Mangrovibacter yixingensis]